MPLLSLKHTKMCATFHEPWSHQLEGPEVQSDIINNWLHSWLRSHKLPLTIKVQIFAFLFSTVFMFYLYENGLIGNVSWYYRCVCLLWTCWLWAVNCMFGFSTPQEDLHLVHYIENDLHLYWANIFWALSLLSTTINEIHLRSWARQINPIRFCHSFCVLLMSSPPPLLCSLSVCSLPFFTHSLALFYFCLSDHCGQQQLCYVFSWNNGC